MKRQNLYFWMVHFQYRECILYIVMVKQRSVINAGFFPSSHSVYRLTVEHSQILQPPALVDLDTYY